MGLMKRLYTDRTLRTASVESKTVESKKPKAKRAETSMFQFGEDEDERNTPPWVG